MYVAATTAVEGRFAAHNSKFEVPPLFFGDLFEQERTN